MRHVAPQEDVRFQVDFAGVATVAHLASSQMTENALHGLLQAFATCQRHPEAVKAIIVLLIGEAGGAPGIMYPVAAPHELLQVMSALPQALFCFTSGPLDASASAVVCACDVAVGEAVSSEFQVRGRRLTAEQMQELGFVSSFASGREALLREQERVKRELGFLSAQQIAMMKHRMQAVRASRQNHIRELHEFTEAFAMVPGQAGKPPSPGPGSRHSGQQAASAAGPLRVGDSYEAQGQAHHPAFHMSAWPPGMPTGCGARNDSRAGPALTSHAEGLTSATKSAAKRSSKDSGKTSATQATQVSSIMVYNIPCRVQQSQLSDVVDNLGFAGKYNFLYLPYSGRPCTGSLSNLGYGFVNFTEDDDAARFTTSFAGYQFKEIKSEKVSSSRLADVQGFVENIRHWCKSTAHIRSRVHIEQPVVRFDLVDAAVTPEAVQELQREFDLRLQQLAVHVERMQQRSQEGRWDRMPEQLQSKGPAKSYDSSVPGDSSGDVYVQRFRI
ncbi:unnamed protein product [Polarella glacialis]|uniref:RRM domain-containing protein n=1 Tax=Polarella glacialis TaxID=89957 RepID=A0A813I031_POLGL|nr:unnamed protein product [Polarella glacialis]